MTETTPPVPPSQPPPGVEPPPPPPEGAIPPPPPPPPGGPYPTTFSVDYPDRELDKTKTFWRLPLMIPIAVILSTIGGFYVYGNGSGGALAAGFGGLLVVPTALMIIFEEKYPRWWFDFNRELIRFISRVTVYFMLMTDEYPSTDEQQTVHLEIKYPNVKEDLHRFLPLIKWLLAVPHYIILFFLTLGAIAATIYAWFVILFTGRYPDDVFELVEGIIRWHLRVYSYAFLMTTDEYPPFKLAP